MEDIKNVLKRIKLARKEKGISHEVIAYDLGISQAAYSNIENQQTQLSVERLIRISIILEKPIYYFFETKPSNVYNQTISDNSNGHIENLYQDNKDTVQTLVDSYKNNIVSLKEEIEFLRDLVRIKNKNQ